MSITVRTQAKTVTVTAPYHPDFVTGARNLGGKWNKPDWTFDARDEQRVRELCVTVYGTDGSATETVDVQVSVDHRSDNPFFAYGREIAVRKGRDVRVTLGAGVVVIEGTFESSCGSSKYPKLTNGTVTLEVRDVPIALTR